MTDLDPRTGRPFGDHGTAQDAIDFALETNQDDFTYAFLKCWNEGDLTEWPEFYPWLAKRAALSTTTEAGK